MNRFSAVLLGVRLTQLLFNNTHPRITTEEIDRLTSKNYPKRYSFLYYAILLLYLLVILIGMIPFCLFSIESVLTSTSLTGYVDQQHLSVLMLIIFITFVILPLIIGGLAAGLSFTYLLDKFLPQNFKDYTDLQTYKSGWQVRGEDLAKSSFRILFIFTTAYIVLIILFYLKVIQF